MDDAPNQARKSLIRRIELFVLVLLVPVALVYGWRAWNLYRVVEESESLFRSAESRMEKRDWKGALQELEQCVAVNPVYFPAYEAMADIQWEEYKDKEALVQVLDRALVATPEDPRSHRLYGLYCVAVLKDYKRGQQELRAAALRMPDDLPLQKLLRKADAEVARKSL